MSDDRMTTYAAYLSEYEEITMTNMGSSMLPMIRQGRDVFTLTRKTEARCQKYDVILYTYPSGKHVMHRVVEVRDGDYVVLGDNCIDKEYGIRDEDIIAVMTRFVHKGREYTVEDKAYRRYAAFWYAIYPLRRCLMRGRRGLGRIVHKRQHRPNRQDQNHNEKK